MLGTDRAGIIFHDVMNGELHLVPFKSKSAVAADGGIEIEMQVAVTHMAETDRPRAREFLRHTAVASSMKAGLEATGREMSCLMAAPSRFSASDSLAQAPEIARLGLVLRHHGIRHRPRPSRPHASCEHAAPAPPDISISTYQGDDAASGSRVSPEYS